MTKKIKRFNSLRTQLMVRFLLLTVVMFGLLGINEYRSLKYYLYESKSEFLDSRFRNLNGNYVVNIESNELLNSYATYFMSEIIDQNVAVVIVNQEGKPIAIRNVYTGIVSKSDGEEIRESMSVPIESTEAYQNLLADHEMDSQYYIVEDETGQKQMVIYRQIGDIDDPIGLIQISTNIDDIEKLLYEQRNIFIISISMVLLVGGLLGWSILTLTLKPLRKMQQTVSEINPTQLDTRLNIETGQSEINDVSQSFNQMMERLEWSFLEQEKLNHKMKSFISDVSHELRTPLTSIQGFVEVLQMGAAKDEKKLDRALNSILIESKRLTKLVNGLLLLTKFDDDVVFEAKNENIKKVIDEIYPQLEVLAENRTVVVDVVSDAYCYINKDHLKQVVYNLFQNALKYTDPLTGKIVIRGNRIIKQNQSWVKLEIEDNGQGIPSNKLPFIFERFYRAHDDRSRDTGGDGLGLSIVKSIVDHYKGTIEVTSVVSKGTCVIIYFQESHH